MKFREYLNESEYLNEARGEYWIEDDGATTIKNVKSIRDLSFEDYDNGVSLNRKIVIKSPIRGFDYDSEIHFWARISLPEENDVLGYFEDFYIKIEGFSEQASKMSSDIFKKLKEFNSQVRCDVYKLEDYIKSL